MIYNKVFYSFFIIFFLPSSSIRAGDSIQNTLSIEQTLNIVRAYHPISLQAKLIVEKAKANKLIAKSEFVPKFSYSQSTKSLDSTLYYDYNSQELNIPLWFGIEVSAGANNLAGERINESQTSGISSYTEISIPLLKNLLIDKRRATLKQANTLITMSDAEQKLALNNLLYEASEAYWNWVKSFELYKIVQKNVAVNTERVRLISMSYFNGERAVIDTIEAYTQLLHFKTLEAQLLFEYQKNTLNLSAFLWTQNLAPYNLSENVLPLPQWDKNPLVNNYNSSIVDLENTTLQNHPYIAILNSKNEFLNIERKLKFQEYLPKLNMNYSLLSKNYNLFQNFNSATSLQDNYQLGLKFEMPLIFMKGQGEYKMANLKIQENKFFMDQKRRDLTIKVINYYNEYLTLKNQILIHNQNYNNYKMLFNAEQTKLYNGESSLFLINMRENKVLEAFEKLVELKTKFYKSFYSIQWATGSLL